MTSQEYWREIQALAREVKQMVADGAEETEALDELIDSHEWVIYTAQSLEVLTHSTNEGALFEELGATKFENFTSAVAQMAYFAMVADVQGALSRTATYPSVLA